MVQPTVSDCPTGSADRETSDVEFVSGAIAILGDFIDNLKIAICPQMQRVYLVKCRKDVVGKLNLCYRRPADGSITRRKARNALLRQRSIEDTLGAWTFAIISDSACATYQTAHRARLCI